MKSATEKRLLVALLLSSLVPLLALGFLAAASVDRMGREVERQTVEARRARIRSVQSARCLRLAEKLAAFLRKREGELVQLAALAPAAEPYQTFWRRHLAPVWTRSADGEKARIWVPLYTELSFIAFSGREELVVRDGAPVPAEQRRDLRSDPQEWAFVRRVLFLDPGELAVAPAGEGGGQPFASFHGALRLWTPVRSDASGPRGAVSATIDPRQVAQRVFESDVLDEVEAPRDGTGRAVFFFGRNGVPFFYPTPLAGLRGEAAPFVRRHLGRAVERVRARASDVVGPTDTGQCLAYAPILLPVETDGSLHPVGGVVIYQDSRLEWGSSPPEAVSSVARGTQARIALLTAAATFGVALAAFLVARRMSRPWALLQEKALAVAPPSDRPRHTNELEGISHSLDALASQVQTSAGRLRASEARLREFIEMNPDGIAVTDTHGRLLHFNRALCHMLRRTPAELSHLSLSDLYAQPVERDRILQELREQGRLTNYRIELLRGDGKPMPALLTLWLAQDHGKECIDAVVRDLSELLEVQRRDREKTEALFHVYGELSRAHQELRQAYAQVEDQVREKTAELRHAYESLQASDRVKTEFLMKMSHELRTPLNCIIGYSEAMADGLDGPVTREQSHSLERIAQSGRRLLRMIENLLDLSRIETGRMDLACVPTRVEEAIEEVIHQARSLVGDRPLRLEIRLEEPLPEVWADPDRLRQVLFNLVGNALKFTERGRVAIEAERSGARSVTVRVADTGPGIPPRHLESIFDKFVQVPGSNRGGVGLGLAICRELVQGMGGSIRAESTVGEGSVFTLALPVADRRGQLSLPLGSPPALPDGGSAASDRPSPTGPAPS
ncbi:MAG: hypothetical protein Kow0092_19020 [Deferrisomatales bacterium]